MLKLLILLGFILPAMALGQPVPSPIHFEQAPTWEEAQKKARDNNKFIFIDCYATWCAPCKYMDSVIFSDKRVGDYFNNQFISIRLDLDSIKKKPVLPRLVKYKAILDALDITELPTYLFFDTAGRIMHKITGIKTQQEMLAEAQQSRTADNNYEVYGLLKRQFRANEIPLKAFNRLIEIADKNNEPGFAGAVFSRYKKEYLNNAPGDSLLSPPIIKLLVHHIDSLYLDDQCLDILVNNYAIVDQLYQKEGLASSLLKSVYNRPSINQDLMTRFTKASVPDWQSLHTGLSARWGPQKASEIVLTYQVKWLQENKKWKEYITHFIKLVDTEILQHQFTGLTAIVYWNNNAWEVFKYSTNPQELKTALQWIERGMTFDNNPNLAMLDTKGNLLYKLGRKKEAIDIMQQAYHIDSSYIGPTLAKMKAGLPTWDGL